MDKYPTFAVIIYRDEECVPIFYRAPNQEILEKYLATKGVEDNVTIHKVVPRATVDDLLITEANKLRQKKEEVEIQYLQLTKRLESM